MDHTIIFETEVEVPSGDRGPAGPGDLPPLWKRRVALPL